MIVQVKQNMNSAEDKNLLWKLRTGAEWVLKQQIAPFWISMRDDAFGGYYGRKDFNLQLYPQADKGVILNSRILYFFSELARLTGTLRYTAEAEHAYDFLMQYCLDRISGGVFWSVTYNGKPSDTTKHTYNHAFAIYALSSYYALTKNKNALNTAMQLFYLIEKKCFDGDGYLEAFNRDWKPVRNDKLSENNVIAYRTMNTLLHIFEAYSNLYQQTNSTEVSTAMIKILYIYRDRIYNPDRKRQEVFFDENYHSLIDLHSFGHDIESSWLIDEGCQLLGDSGIAQDVKSINQTLASEIYQTAYQKDSVCNECENGTTDTDRIWWVQAESVIGFVNMWQKTHDLKYIQAAEHIWQYIQEYLVDTRPESEWFWGVDESGRPLADRDMSDEWKCPYHNGRMCFELIRRR